MYTVIMKHWPLESDGEANYIWKLQAIEILIFF